MEHRATGRKCQLEHDRDSGRGCPYVAKNQITGMGMLAHDCLVTPPMQVSSGASKIQS